VPDLHSKRDRYLMLGSVVDLLLLLLLMMMMVI